MSSQSEFGIALHATNLNEDVIETLKLVASGKGVVDELFEEIKLCAKVAQQWTGINKNIIEAWFQQACASRDLLIAPESEEEGNEDAEQKTPENDESDEPKEKGEEEQEDNIENNATENDVENAPDAEITKTVTSNVQQKSRSKTSIGTQNQLGVFRANVLKEAKKISERAISAAVAAAVAAALRDLKPKLKKKRKLRL